MATHLQYKLYSREYFKAFFKRFQGIWGRAAEPFIFVRHSSKFYEILFLDELNPSLNAYPPRYISDLRVELRVELRRQRKINKKSLKEWARQLGTNESNLSAIENGRRPIGKIMRARIETFLNLNPHNAESLIKK